MKKIILSLLASNILLSVISPTVALASEQSPKNTSMTTAAQSTSDQQSYLRLENGDEIVTRIGTENLVSFQITENGEEFDLTFDFEMNEVIVGNNVYNIDEYLSAIRAQETIQEAVTLIEPLRTVQSKDSASALELENFSTVSLMATLPTTGYNSLVNFGSYRQINMQIGLATAALTAIAAFVFRGNVQLSQAFVVSALNKGVEAGIIASTLDYFYSDVYYIKKQATHSTVVGAVKEVREPYTLVQSTKVYGPAYTWYFWSINPY